MKPIYLLFVLTVISFQAFAGSQKQTKSNNIDVEVCFVLDTTGSMSGLIDGAKRSIWSIAKNIVNLMPKPNVKFCLLGYRDRGDVYITKLTDLDPDIENIYAALKTFQAQGGGDAPESVNQALYESVNHVSWSSEPNVLKIIFLVGDAPPHMDYPEEVQYPGTVLQAMKKGITISTIQCGNMQSTTSIWKKIANSGQGVYSKLIQSGNVKVIRTPMDQDFAALNIKLGLTIIPYGISSRQENVIQRQLDIQSDSQSIIADRLSFYSQAPQTKKQTYDLVSDIANGFVSYDDLKSLNLPKDMQAMTPREQISHIKEHSKYREIYNQVIKKLVEEREEYLLIHKNNKGMSFDQEVLNGIKTVAQRKGIIFQ